MVWTVTHRSSMDLKCFCSCFCRITGYIQKLGTNGRPTSNYTKTSSTMCLNFAHRCFNQVVQWPQNTFGNERDEIPGMEGKGLDSELPKAARNRLAIQFVATLILIQCCSHVAVRSGPWRFSHRCTKSKCLEQISQCHFCPFQALKLQMSLSSPCQIKKQMTNTALDLKTWTPHEVKLWGQNQET